MSTNLKEFELTRGDFTTAFTTHPLEFETRGNETCLFQCQFGLNDIVTLQARLSPDFDYQTVFTQKGVAAADGEETVTGALITVPGYPQFRAICDNNSGDECRVAMYV